MYRQFEKNVASLPLVSIIIPVYNGSNYVESAINSCLQQTYNNCEIIVVNDGSTDNTESICLEYKDKIRYFYKENGGVSSALNLGISNSRGEFISWLSHDDVYNDSKIASQVKCVVDKNKFDSIVYSNYTYTDENLNSVIDINFDDLLNTKNLNMGYILVYGWFLHGCSILIPKSQFVKHGLFDEKLKYTQDYAKWFQLVDEDFIYDNTFVTKVRLHANQTTQTSKSVNEEDDILWYEQIKYLYDNKLYDRFLGYYGTAFYLNFRFLNSDNLPKTKILINSVLSIDHSKKKCARTINKKIYYKPSLFLQIKISYKKNGLLKTLRKIFRRIFNFEQK